MCNARSTRRASRAINAAAAVLSLLSFFVCACERVGGPCSPKVEDQSDSPLPRGPSTRPPPPLQIRYLTEGTNEGESEEEAGSRGESRFARSFA